MDERRRKGGFNWNLGSAELARGGSQANIGPATTNRIVMAHRVGKGVALIGAKTGRFSGPTIYKP